MWGAFASLGVTALLTASHLAYTVLRWIGAAYLIWMGFRMFREPEDGRLLRRCPAPVPPRRGHFTMGLLLTTVHIAIGLLWSAVLIGFARVLQGWLRKPRARRLLDRITGTVIGVFGIRLTLDN